jgi:hypothetical protein
MKGDWPDNQEMAAPEATITGHAAPSKTPPAILSIFICLDYKDEFRYPKESYGIFAAFLHLDGPAGAAAGIALPRIRIQLRSAAQASMRRRPPGACRLKSRKRPKRDENEGNGDP